MATINSTIKLTDRMTSPLHSITNALKSTLDALESMKGSMDESFDTSKIDAARKSIESTNASINNLSGHIEEAKNQQNRFNSEVDKGTSGVSKLVGAFAGMIGIKKLVGLSDEFSQSRARLNLMNNSLEETKALEDKIFASAQRSRAAYQDTANAVAKLGATAKKSFSSNDEIVRFVELMNKNFIVGGSSSTEQASAMYQLTQAMSSGRLQGDEYRSIIENAPLLAKAIEDYMRNVQHAKGSMKDWASEGKLTAKVIKNALFSTAEETNRKFESMPMTWGQVWTNICNRVYKASQPLLQVINVIANNWSIIEPIILGVAAAIGLYLLVTKGASAATAVWTSIQAGFNAVMAMNPIFIIIMAIVLLIGIIYAVVAAINKAKDTSISATGVIAGSIFVVGALIFNFIIGIINGIVQIIDTCANIIISVIEWVLNVCGGGFNGFGGMVANLIGNIISWFLDLGKVVTKIIDAIFGTNWTSGLNSLSKKVTSWGKNENAITLERWDHSIDRISYSDAYNKGYSIGQKIDNKISNMFGNNETDNILDSIKNDTDSISKNMDITSEDLKYLRDLAEQEAINRFTTAEIKIDLGGVTNNVSSNMDLDGVVSYIADELSIAVEEVARGA